MVSPVMLQRINLRLQAIRKNTLPFGNIHIALMGDPMQLPPVLATTLYKTPDPEKPHYGLAMAGHHLFLNFTKVVTLTENMRVKEDPDYTALLTLIRSGKAPANTSLFAGLHTRYRFRAENAVAAAEAQRFSDAPIIVPTNEARHAFNRAVLSARCTLDDIGTPKMIRLDATLSRSKGLDDNTKKYLYTIGDERTGRLPPVLHIYEGMPAMISVNQAVELGIANGQLCTIVKLQEAPNTTWKNCQDNSLRGGTVRVPSVQPEIIFVKLNNFDASTECQQLKDLRASYNLEPGTIPIFPDQGRGERIPLGKNHAINIKITQFPLVTAFSITIHKIQGQTLDRCVIGSFKNSFRDYATFSAIYVALSRARKLSSILLLEDFSDALPARMVIPDHLQNELDRFKRLEAQTATVPLPQ